MTRITPDGTELQAPEGKFRVVGVDTFDGGEWVYGDFDDRETAMNLAKAKGATMLKTHVYDDTGRHLGGFGTF